MLPYYIVFFLLALFAFWDTISIKVHQRTWALLFLSLILVLFATFRGNIGFQDYDEYAYSYADIVHNGLWSENYSSSAAIFEPGFVLIYYLCSLITPNPIFGFWVISLIAVSLNLLCYKQYSKYFLIALILYFVHTFVLREMMQIRAGVAAAVCLYSIRYIEERRIGAFMCSILMAISFHLASIIFIFAYWVYVLDWSKRTWMWIVGICLTIGLVMPLGKLLSMTPLGGIGERIAVYTWMIGSSSGIFTNPTILKQLFIVILCFSYWETLNDKVPHFKILSFCLMMSLCWLLLWNDFPIISGRLGTFFSITEVMVIPSFLYIVTPRSRSLVFLIITLYAFLILWLNIRVGNFVLYNSGLTLPETL